MSIEEIQAPVWEEMKIFEQKFKGFMKSDVALLDQIMRYIIHSKGKQIRPMFVFLMAGACGTINESTHRGAALIELLHTASLVHDDVVDDANERRGLFSINALWKNKIAVLVGDFLLSKGLLLSVDNQDFNLLKLVSQAVKQMSEGELLQMEKARKLDITQEIYFEIIRQKTAALIASCCAVGAASVGSDEKKIQEAREFGEKIGMAFQIKDDLFDFGEAEIGKPRGIDIKEKKLTLPLIYALSTISVQDKKKTLTKIRNQSEKKEVVQEIIAFVRESGGILYAMEKMQEFVKDALSILDNWSDSIHKTSLQNLVIYTIERKK